MLYEPKFDGFRCIVFRDGDEVELGAATSDPSNFPKMPGEPKRVQPSKAKKET